MRKWPVILKAFASQLVSLPVLLSSYIIVPVALAFCREDDEHLPHWLSWFDEPTYGINGDDPWRGPEHANGHEREYKWRLRWLFRNALGGWSHDVMGFNAADITAVEWKGDPDTSNRPGHSGECWIRVTLRDGSQRECYYVVKQWGDSAVCWRGYFGYKLMDVLHAHIKNDPLVSLGQTQDVFSPNPFMGFEL